ncbi:hypothetical protein PAXINDRAFT_183156 [Paxillus involutus ATCC 200175]|uniref:Uncharacterized protein n=1 Tax=Paxillus involutus ATCC 200175 TaxID=664439 RepID=A0A0C9SLH7_PAXIN|nr:hypothetical protein PAXINDRAFT_183156 [Paxillus involutus ATCC 200175]
MLATPLDVRVREFTVPDRDRASTFLPPPTPSLSPLGNTVTLLSSSVTPLHATTLPMEATYHTDLSRAPTTNGDQTLHVHDSWTRGRWTGVPIRAIIPLPRRTQQAVRSTPLSPSDVRRNAGAHAGTCATSVNDNDNNSDRRLRDDMDSGDDSEENESHAVVVINHEVGCCSYESITAAVGLSSWSFEELRVECYAQSFIARGGKPLPVDKPSLAIPPAFVPRPVPRWTRRSSAQRTGRVLEKQCAKYTTENTY